MRNCLPKSRQTVSGPPVAYILLYFFRFAPRVLYLWLIAPVGTNTVQTTEERVKREVRSIHFFVFFIVAAASPFQISGSLRFFSNTCPSRSGPVQLEVRREAAQYDILIALRLACVLSGECRHASGKFAAGPVRFRTSDYLIQVAWHRAPGGPFRSIPVQYKTPRMPWDLVESRIGDGVRNE